MTVIGSSLSLQQYAAPGYNYAAVAATLNSEAQPGPQHVIFTTPDYMYVLPSGIYLTQQNTPLISSVTANGDGTLTVAGSNWNFRYPDLFRQPARFDYVSLNPQTGVAVVGRLPGASNQTATLTAYNSDGQNSQFYRRHRRCSTRTGGAAAPQITIGQPGYPARWGRKPWSISPPPASPSRQGLTTVGFGTTDVVVQQRVRTVSTHPPGGCFRCEQRGADYF